MEGIDERVNISLPKCIEMMHNGGGGVKARQNLPQIIDVVINFMICIKVLLKNTRSTIFYMNYLFIHCH